MAKGNAPSTRTKKLENVPVSWAQAIRDMVISAINKGQLPIFGLFLVILMLIYKMPEADVSKLVFEILDSLRRGEFVAYILLSITIFGWFVHARVMRKTFTDEAKRIGREKSNLQSQLAGIKFKSSNKT
jgi:hypothetical protein